MIDNAYMAGLGKRTAVDYAHWGFQELEKPRFLQTSAWAVV